MKCLTSRNVSAIIGSGSGLKVVGSEVKQVTSASVSSAIGQMT
jgi:hypothetical protein